MRPGWRRSYVPRSSSASWSSRERVLGPDHPDTLTTRSWVDYLQRQTGDES